MADVFDCRPGYPISETVESPLDCVLEAGQAYVSPARRKLQIVLPPAHLLADRAENTRLQRELY